MDKPYKITDYRGNGRYQASGLYTNPNNNYNKYRPRFYTVQDTKKAVTPSDRITSTKYGRSLFATLPDLGGALLSKASWACGPSSFTPIHTGDNTAWGEEAEQWLQETFYPVCNVAGANYDFRTTLYQTSLALDIDGDNLIVLTTTRDGFPQVQVVPAHRIGSRSGEDVVTDGKYKGLTIIDGVIINKTGRPIAYRILGDTKDDDYDLSAQSSQLLFEPEWCDQYRGISRVARPLADFMDQQDIDDFLKQGVKLASQLGIIHHTETGQPATDSNIVGLEETIGGSVSEAPPRPPVEVLDDVGIIYAKAGAGEKIESLKDERPSQNTQAFVERIQRRALFSIGWPIELLDPSKVGGASVRLIQDLARKTIAARQVTLEKRAKLIVCYAISKAMGLGLISNNDVDPFNWSFTKGSVVCVDNGNESSADREGYKLGTTTLSEIASKKGLDWMDIRKQAKRETCGLLDDAAELSIKYKISMDAAIALLSQKNTNQPVLVGQPVGQTQTI